MKDSILLTEYIRYFPSDIRWGQASWRRIRNKMEICLIETFSEKPEDEVPFNLELDRILPIGYTVSLSESTTFKLKTTFSPDRITLGHHIPGYWCRTYTLLVPISQWEEEKNHG